MPIKFFNKAVETKEETLEATVNKVEPVLDKSVDAARKMNALKKNDLLEQGIQCLSECKEEIKEIRNGKVFDNTISNVKAANDSKQEEVQNTASSSVGLGS